MLYKIVFYPHEIQEIDRDSPENQRAADFFVRVLGIDEEEFWGMIASQSVTIENFVIDDAGSVNSMRIGIHTPDLVSQNVTRTFFLLIRWDGEGHFSDGMQISLPHYNIEFISFMSGKARKIEKNIGSREIIEFLDFVSSDHPLARAVQNIFIPEGNRARFASDYAQARNGHREQLSNFFFGQDEAGHYYLNIEEGLDLTSVRERVEEIKQDYLQTVSHLVERYFHRSVVDPQGIPRLDIIDHINRSENGTIMVAEDILWNCPTNDVHELERNWRLYSAADSSLDNVYISYFDAVVRFLNMSNRQMTITRNTQFEEVISALETVRASQVGRTLTDEVEANQQLFYTYMTSTLELLSRETNVVEDLRTWIELIEEEVRADSELFQGVDDCYFLIPFVSATHSYSIINNSESEQWLEPREMSTVVEFLFNLMSIVPYDFTFGEFVEYFYLHMGG
ncbi:hypothetical protein ACFL56_00795 [Candidatus Margulisiibacteriota bacterium]